MPENKPDYNQWVQEGCPDIVASAAQDGDANVAGTENGTEQEEGDNQKQEKRRGEKLIQLDFFQLKLFKILDLFLYLFQNNLSVIALHFRM